MIAAWLLAVTAMPQILEWTGVFAPTWWMIDGGVCSRSAFLQGTSRLDAIELMITNLALLATSAVYAVRINRSASDARHKLHVQAWHLGRLLPAGPSDRREGGPPIRRP